MSSARSSFLSRVADAVRVGNRHREPPGPEIDPSVGYIGAGADPISRLVDELRAAGAQPARTASVDELHGMLQLLLERHRVEKVIRGADLLIDRLGVDRVLQAAGVEVFTPADLAGLNEESRSDPLFSAGLGIAVPDWALAESGTLVYVAGPGQTRSASLLPPVHLAIVDARRILPDLFDLPSLLAQLEASQRPLILPNTVLVTGPSKTGDIEMRLTTGVHGPGELHVIIWEESTSS